MNNRFQSAGTYLRFDKISVFHQSPMAHLFEISEDTSWNPPSYASPIEKRLRRDYNVTYKNCEIYVDSKICSGDGESSNEIRVEVIMSVFIIPTSLTN